MAHNRLVLLMSTIPSSVVELNSNFNLGIFNADKTKRQIDGYLVDKNEDIIEPKTLCHAKSYLLYLCRGEADPEQTVQSILDSSYELKVSDYRIMTNKPENEWYIEEVIT